MSGPVTWPTSRRRSGPARRPPWAPRDRRGRGGGRGRGGRGERNGAATVPDWWRAGARPVCRVMSTPTSQPRRR